MSKQIRVSRAENMSLREKLNAFSWPLFALMVLCLALSVAMLYSAGHAECPPSVPDCNWVGAWRPWALSQLSKIMLGLIIFFIAAFSNIKTWIKTSYWVYAGALILIILVTFMGHTGMGAQRWLNLGFVSVQPSEFIKIALVIALARYFAWFNSTELSQLKNYLAPLAMMLVPFALILYQPDLGTAITLGLITVGMFFIVGAPRKWFIVSAILMAVAAPVVWRVGMHDYQRARLLTFIQPEYDLRGAGYQINQAKIAFGSGGIFGKGYLSGTQSQLSFLPENQTDFIFTMFGEEIGFVGAFALLIIYSAIIIILFRYSRTMKNRFGQLLCFGFMLNFFIYYFINVAMVLGLLPTVGV
ncbi:MAG: rod shape-determining protein RodA, partial [Proteobacteria bacterium]|nr:rod shape-determining protein RodA [Pseudomonadota bacterium]